MGQQVASVRAKAGLMMLQATLIEKRPFGRFFFARLSASLVRDNPLHHVQQLCRGSPCMDRFVPHELGLRYSLRHPVHYKHLPPLEEN